MEALGALTTGDERLLLAAINRDLVQSIRLRDPEFKTRVPAFNALDLATQLDLCSQFMAGVIRSGGLPTASSREAVVLTALADHLPRVVQLELLEETEEESHFPAIDARHLLVDAARSLGIDVPAHVRSTDPSEWETCVRSVAQRWRLAAVGRMLASV